MKKILIIGGAGYVGSKINEVLGSKYNIHNVDLNWFGATKDAQFNFVDYNDITDRYIKRYLGIGKEGVLLLKIMIRR